ncbi:MAG: NAD-dependent epimerase/dehydratase family protein [Deltaproteobacteria bacterium]|nr:NAD-dependent epimerase/dehydratase family protein [Deltaproteobacteria bacterium]
MKSALVTGGAGFIGSHLADRLLNEGFQVTILDDLSMGVRDNIPAKATFVEGSLLDRELLGRLTASVDVVFHEAARVSIRESVKHFREDARTNVEGTLNLLDALRDSSVKRLVFASSMGVYGKDGVGVKETDTDVPPLSPYGVGKLAGEGYCLRLCPEMGIDCVALRYCNTYGPRQTPTPYVGVTTIFINALLSGQQPTIYDDGEQIRDYVYVGDIVEANMRALTTTAVNDFYNVGTGVGVSVNQVLAGVASHLGVEAKPRYLPKQRSELRAFTADVSKAAERLDFRARHRFEDRVGEVVDYWRARATRGGLPGFRAS